MALRALLYRRPSEPSSIQVLFDRSIYPVRLRRHRQARRYTLRIDAASREVVLTLPPRGTVREARDFAQKHGAWIAARLKRLPQAAPFVHGTEVPLRGELHRIVHRRGVRGTVWTAADDEGNGLLCVAGEAPHINRRIGDYLRRSAARELEAAARRYAAGARGCNQANLHSGPVEPLGFVLQHRGLVVFLAADPRAAVCAGLSGGARSCPPRRTQPFATVLAAGRAHLPGFRTRQGLARGAWHRSAPLRCVRRSRIENRRLTSGGEQSRRWLEARGQARGRTAHIPRHR